MFDRLVSCFLAPVVHVLDNAGVRTRKSQLHAYFVSIQSHMTLGPCVSRFQKQYEFYSVAPDAHPDFLSSRMDLDRHWWSGSMIVSASRG